MFKIVFLSHFSNDTIRSYLSLRKYNAVNYIKRRLGKPQYMYDDFAIWVTDYISEFERHKEIEFHIVSPHAGMKAAFQHFSINGIYYHFFRNDGPIISNILKEKLKFDEKHNYASNRRKIKKIIDCINPDLLILCGAENPQYGTSVLDINDTPICVILQTLLNDPKRIEMNVGSLYRRNIENAIFKHAQYFCTTDKKASDYILSLNQEAIVFPVRFPTHRPVVAMPEKKDFDFVFFARNITKNKGIEDLLHSLVYVKESYPNITLNVIGNCEVSYKEHLLHVVDDHNLQDNVCFAGYYDRIDDTYNKVVKARVVVVPGITAALNSTVRESMLMGMPVICYESAVTDEINRENHCLITAQMSDVQDLALMMLFAIKHPNDLSTIAANGKQYADNNYSNSAIVDNLLDNCLQITHKHVGQNEKNNPHSIN